MEVGSIYIKIIYICQGKVNLSQFNIIHYMVVVGWPLRGTNNTNMYKVEEDIINFLHF